MLSRVANSLFWMSRYMERAENTARIVDVNLQLLLDFRNLDDRRLAEHWTPIVQSTGDEERFRSLYTAANGQTVTDFLVFRIENPNSIVSAVSQARENARMVRDQITAEMFQLLGKETEQFADALMDESAPMQESATGSPPGMGGATGAIPASNQTGMPQSMPEMAARSQYDA